MFGSLMNAALEAVANSAREADLANGPPDDKCSLIADGVILTRTDPSYQGCPQIIKFSGSVSDNDYISFYIGGDRKKWEWCKDKTSVEFSGEYDDTSVSIKYYKDGGMFVSGKELIAMNYTLRNPLLEFEASQRNIEVGSSITVSYALEHIPPSCKIVLKRNGMRLSTLTPRARQGQVVIKSPRLPGHCEVVFLASSTGDVVLRSKSINVTDDRNLSETKLWFDGHSIDQKLLAVPNNQLVQVKVSGELLVSSDRVVVLQESNMNNFFTPPSETSLQVPLESHTIGSNGTVTLSHRSEGVFYVCLALGNENHANLLGNWITLIVSDRVGHISHTSESTSARAVSIPAAVSVQDIPPRSSSTTTAEEPNNASSRFTCVICFDLPVSIKYDPCKHVCVCEDCQRRLEASRSNTACPICRGKITKWEKVFLS